MSRATQPLQRTVTGTLVDLPALVAAAGLHAPSLVIIGDCIQVRDQARWFEGRPLFGRVIGITRPEDRANDTALRAYELGALPNCPSRSLFSRVQDRHVSQLFFENRVATVDRKSVPIN